MRTVVSREVACRLETVAAINGSVYREGYELWAHTVLRPAGLARMSAAQRVLSSRLTLRRTCRQIRLARGMGGR